MKFYGRYGDLNKHYEVSLSQMVHDILGHDHIHWRPQWIRPYTSLWPYYQTWPYYGLWPYYQILGGFYRTLQRVRLADRGRLLLRTPSPVPFGTCICSYVETIFSWACHVSGLWISNIPRYFYFALSLLASTYLVLFWHHISISNNTLFGVGSLITVQYPKYAHGPYC